MTTPFIFKLLANDGDARLGEITTPRGIIRTPAFMPVGTAATVKAMFTDTVKATHLMLRPGAERIARLGGLHRFMRWNGPILTDSGGYQIMSLSQLRTVSERGVTFRSHIDGALYELTPERSVEVQNLLGADVQMQFDECMPYPAARGEGERSMQLSLRWLNARLRLSKSTTNLGAPCSASCKAAFMRSSGRNQPNLSPPWVFTAIRWAA